MSTLLSTPSMEGCEATKIVKGLCCPILILRKTLLSKVKSVIVSAWTDRRFKKKKKKDHLMHRSNEEKISEGGIWVVKTLEMFFSGEAQLFSERPNVSILDFTNKDKKIMTENVVIHQVLEQMAESCPLFTSAQAGNLVHIHNFGASFVTKYSNEYFVRKIAIDDRSALMFWARENCEILETRSSEFQEGNAEIENTTSFGNVIPFNF